MATITGTVDNDSNLTAPLSKSSSIYGFSGNDVLTGSSLADFFHGGDRDWVPTDDIGGFRLVGENDVINAGGGNDVIVAGPGHDNIDGGTGIDAVLFGQWANFMVKVGTNVYSSTPMAMSDLTVNLANGSYTGSYILNGKLIRSASGSLTGIESVTGTVQKDHFIGSGRDEFFRPLGGVDTIDGGAGYDILRYDNASIGQTETHGVNVDFDLMKVNDTEGNIDLFSGIEHVIGSAHGDNFKGFSGSQVFTGGDGSDTIDGSYERDTLNYSFETGTKGVHIELGNFKGWDTFGKVDKIFGIEIVKATDMRDKLFGMVRADELHGRGERDHIEGNGGNDLIIGDTSATETVGWNDTLLGGDGNDKVYGCGGNDSIDGGTGNDLVDGGAGNDTWYSSGDRGHSIVIDLSKGTMLYAFLNEKDTLKSIENVYGSFGDDVITGDKAANSLDGGAGNDTIAGGLGLDTMYGGVGTDTVDYGASTLAVTADLSGRRATFAGVAGYEQIVSFENIFGSELNDKFWGTVGNNVMVGDEGNDTMLGLEGHDDLEGGGGNDSVDGGDGNDFLGGGAGADVLKGWGGGDDLFGDTGRDTLSGGLGADHFIFGAIKHSAVGANRDVITDFVRAELDKVDLKGIDADTSKSGNQTFKFIGTAAFSSTTATPVYGELRCKSGIVSGDVNGDGKADFEIAMTGLSKMAAADFIL